MWSKKSSWCNCYNWPHELHIRISSSPLSRKSYCRSCASSRTGDWSEAGFPCKKLFPTIRSKLGLMEVYALRLFGPGVPTDGCRISTESGSNRPSLLSDCLRWNSEWSRFTPIACSFFSSCIKSRSICCTTSSAGVSTSTGVGKEKACRLCWLGS